MKIARFIGSPCINDLPNGIKSTVWLFADDCILYRKIRNNADKISRQKDLEKVAKWARVNKLKINVGETVAVAFSKRREQIFLKYEGYS